MHCILMYHSFGSEPCLAADPLYCIPPQLFREQLQYLADNCPEIVEMNHSISINRDNKLSVSITIDDGDISILTTALPLLKEYKIPATVYLVTGLVGTLGFLSWDDVRKCRQGGISFQSHTHTHRFLDSLTEEEIRNELLTSKKLLEDALGEIVEGLALPGGKGDLSIIGRIAREVGYRYVVTSLWGYNEHATDPYKLERISWMRTQSFGEFKQFVAGDSKVLRHYRFRSAVIKYAKRCLGGKLYEKVKRVIAGNN